jgi:predicted phage tail protein
VLEAGTSPNHSEAGTFAVAGTTLIVPGVPPGLYFVRVRAVSASGISAASNEVPVSVAPLLPPGPPVNLTGFSDGSAVTLSWQAPVSGGTPAGYVLVVGSVSGAADILVQPIGLGTSLFTTGVPPRTYYVRIITSNASGQSAPSNEIAVIVP